MWTNSTNNSIFFVGSEPFFHDDQALFWFRNIHTCMTETSNKFASFAGYLNNTTFNGHLYYNQINKQSTNEINGHFITIFRNNKLFTCFDLTHGDGRSRTDEKNLLLSCTNFSLKWIECLDHLVNYGMISFVKRFICLFRWISSIK